MNKKIVCTSNFKQSYGNAGEVTPFVINGQYLQVGDVVSTCGDSSIPSNDFVVKDDDGRYFIMGLHSIYDTKILVEKWNLKLVKKYYEVENREIVGSLILIDMDEKIETDVKKTLPNEKIEILEYDGTVNCEVCTNRAVFIIAFADGNYDSALCPNCLADLGKKIIDVLR